ncbi:hypothetical protein Cgig2_012300 [Carnegiea gigantea]|uniref:Uncharacterized protein n=1 Tax=Carnegiea gigantea TaxID=171969 RepID=A0A9Q1K343_9CARY|nr:hypothetical protein Cgig2_012300 [Carnegiea gigantea]
MPGPKTDVVTGSKSGPETVVTIGSRSRLDVTTLEYNEAFPSSPATESNSNAPNSPTENSTDRGSSSQEPTAKNLGRARREWKGPSHLDPGEGKVSYIRISPNPAKARPTLGGVCHGVAYQTEMRSKPYRGSDRHGGGQREVAFLVYDVALITGLPVYEKSILFERTEVTGEGVISMKVRLRRVRDTLRNAKEAHAATKEDVAQAKALFQRTDERSEVRRQKLIVGGESMVEPGEGRSTPLHHGGEDTVVLPLSPQMHSTEVRHAHRLFKAVDASLEDTNLQFSVVENEMDVDHTTGEDIKLGKSAEQAVVHMKAVGDNDPKVPRNDSADAPGSLASKEGPSLSSLPMQIRPYYPLTCIREKMIVGVILLRWSTKVVCSPSVATYPSSLLSMLRKWIPILKRSVHMPQIHTHVSCATAEGGLPDPTSPTVEAMTDEVRVTCASPAPKSTLEKQAILNCLMSKLSEDVEKLHCDVRNRCKSFKQHYDWVLYLTEGGAQRISAIDVRGLVNLVPGNGLGV